MIQSGLFSDTDIKERAGHEDYATTQKYYARTFRDKNTDTAKRLSTALNPGISIFSIFLMKQKSPETIENTGFPRLSRRAGGRTRTDTKLPPRDFKSLASANSATPASVYVFESCGQAIQPARLATQNGLEPSISAVTGRRDNQLRHWA